MKKINRKRLDNKGFTLVELLAVVVILALVMGLAATSVLDVMNSSRAKTLYSAAQTAASNVNTWVVEDMAAASASTQKLGNTFIKHTQVDNKNTWICLGSDASDFRINNKGATGGSTLAVALGLNDKDLILTGTAPELAVPEGGEKAVYTINKGDNVTCSAIRYNTTLGAYEVFFHAKADGKYYVANANSNFAFSRAAEANILLTD